MPMEYETVISKLHKKRTSDKNYICPCHDDNEGSLSVHCGKDGKALIHCFAGCPFESIIKALDLQSTGHSNNKSRIITIYSYKNEVGEELFQVVRYEPKSFKQRHKDAKGEWVYNLTGVRRVLYHLPEILTTAETIYIVEGEKDADNLWEWGLIATTSPGGAGNWKPEYAEYLKGKRVVVIPDKDTTGYAYAKDIIRSLQNKAVSIKCILLPGEAKDISDWLEQGGDVADLPSLEQDISVLFDADKPAYQQDEGTISWHKQVEGRTLSFRAESLREERTGIHARVSISCDYQPLSWSLFNIERSEDRIRLANSAHSQLKGDITEKYGKEDLRRDLDLFCAGLWDFHISTFIPEMLRGDDTQVPLKFLLYPYILEGGGTILFAPPGRGKSNSALLWATSINAGVSILWKVAKTPVLFINLERSKQSVRRRLSAVNKILGLPTDHPLLILNARGKSLFEVMPACRKAIKQHGVGLIVLDSISRAGYGDLTENRPVNAIIDALSGLCSTWLALGHTPRGSEEHIYGGIHFDAGADIVIQLSSQITDDGTLGVGFTITKANDLPSASQQIWAFEFGEYGLEIVRRAKPFEFTEIESKRKTNMMDSIIDFITNQDGADATATEIEEAIGFNRATISKVLNKSGRFVKTRRDGKHQFFGIKDDKSHLPELGE